MLTGRIRKGQESDLRRTQIFSSFSDDQRLDKVEQIIPHSASPRRQACR